MSFCFLQDGAVEAVKAACSKEGKFIQDWPSWITELDEDAVQRLLSKSDWVCDAVWLSNPFPSTI